MNLSPDRSTRFLSPIAVSWWLVIVVAVVLAVISAVPLFFLFLVWFIAVPVWSIFVLIMAGICFGVSRSWPRALSFGIGVLGSMPLASVLIFMFLVLASAVD